MMSTAPDEQLSWLVSEIYDAALDPTLWSVVLGNAARFVGGSSAALFSKDTATRRTHLHYASGIDPYYRQLYLDKYVKLDLTRAGSCSRQVEQPTAVADLMPYNEFLETQFYREWGQPQGMVDFVTAVLDRSTTEAAIFGVFRHERDGIVDDATRQRMRFVVPHIRRAMLVGRLIDLKAAATATFVETLDGLSAGICLVDADGHIVHANVAGRAMLDAGDVLCGAGGRIVARDGEADRSLRELVAAADSGDAAIGTQGIALSLRAQDGAHHVVHVLSLTSGRRPAGRTQAAIAALFIRKAAIEQPATPEIIGRAYNLTPTELRVLLAIVEVGGVPEVAASLGVADTTVKTHLGRLFEKTGVGRQADLVKIVAGFATPLVG